MKKILLAFLITSISWAGEVQLNQITNSNALHGLPTGANAYTGTYAQMAAVTNQWCGDHYYATDIGQEFLYQCSTPIPNGTPAYGNGVWVPQLISAPYTTTPTPTNTPTLTPSPTGTWSTFTPTSTPTSTPTPTGTYFTATPSSTSTATPLYPHPTNTPTPGPTTYIPYTDGSLNLFSSLEPTGTAGVTLHMLNAFSIDQEINFSTHGTELVNPNGIGIMRDRTYTNGDFWVDTGDIRIDSSNKFLISVQSMHYYGGAVTFLSGEVTIENNLSAVQLPADYPTPTPCIITTNVYAVVPTPGGAAVTGVSGAVTIYNALATPVATVISKNGIISGI